VTTNANAANEPVIDAEYARLIADNAAPE
jgi:hypothetical protein